MRHPAIRNLTAVRGKIEAHWASCTLPFPEVTIRLLPLHQIAEFERQMHDFASELADAASELGRVFDELKQEAEGRLGALYDASDFPHAPQNLVDVMWDYPNFAAPPFNAGWVSRSVYDLEEIRIRTKFDTAVSLAESGFREEFAVLVARLCERITDSDQAGTSKIFRDTAVVKLVDFVARYFQFNVRTDDRLDDLIILAQGAMQGVTPQALRSNRAL